MSVRLRNDSADAPFVFASSADDYQHLPHNRHSSHVQLTSMPSPLLSAELQLEDIPPPPAGVISPLPDLPDFSSHSPNVDPLSTSTPVADDNPFSFHHPSPPVGMTHITDHTPVTAVHSSQRTRARQRLSHSASLLLLRLRWACRPRKLLISLTYAPLPCFFSCLFVFSVLFLFFFLFLFVVVPSISAQQCVLSPWQ